MSARNRRERRRLIDMARGRHYMALRRGPVRLEPPMTHWEREAARAALCIDHVERGVHVGPTEEQLADWVSRQRVDLERALDGIDSEAER